MLGYGLAPLDVKISANTVMSKFESHKCMGQEFELLNWPAYGLFVVNRSMLGSEVQFSDISIVYLTFCSGADQRKRQSSASQAFVREIHWWPVNFSHKGPVTWKIFPIWWHHHDNSIIWHCLCDNIPISSSPWTGWPHCLNFVYIEFCLYV